MAYCHEHGIPHSKFLKWSPVDRSKALAMSYEKASACSLCGTAEWEWDENKYSYEPTEKFCRGCYLKETSAEDAHRLPGTSIELIPVTDMFRAQQHVARKRRAMMSMSEDDE